ncbi:MAG: SbcC/MukB-like Walker B domain-containing protein [Moraxella sp.]|nr:SbcC/MukB-like Walker B domain-containing protein [Moraxella sp.]
MKILTLNFCNLNSLKGNWKIDFTHHDFINHGIFAITGQTGAGKTTILDAMCLAIYGQTPRIKTISNTQNDLMSTGTAECSSEVVLAVGGKIYRFSWEQRRAGKKPDGKLQAIKREISELDNPSDNHGKILESKLSLCEKKTLEILHMNFEQFTRSVMLAQGNFAAFLKADTNEKGEILEQITGSEIYGKISIKAHEIAKQKREKLISLEEKLDESNVMNDEQFTELSKSITHLEYNLKTEQTTLQEIDTHIKLLENKHYYTMQLTTAQSTFNTVQQKFDKFKPSLDILNKANKAFKIEPIYQELLNVQNQQNKYTSELHTYEYKQPISTDNLQKAVQLTEISLNNYHTHKQTYEASLPVFKQVHELDTRIQHIKAHITYLNEQAAKNTTSIALSNDNINALLTKKQSQTQELKDIHKKLQDMGDYSNLTQDIILIKNHQEQLIKNSNNLNQSTNNITHHQAQLVDINTNIETKRAEYKEQHSTLNLLQAQYQQHNTAILQRLGIVLDVTHDTHYEQALHQYGITLKESIHHHEQLHAMLTTVSSTVHECEILSTKISATQKEIDTINQQKTVITSTITELTNTIAQEESVLAALQSNQQLQQEILLMKRYFDELHQGEPCPLCGSLEHPYKNEPHAHFTDTNEFLHSVQYAQDKLSTLGTELKNHNDELIDINTRLTQANTQYHIYADNLKLTKSQLHQQIYTVNEKLSGLLQDLPSTNNLTEDCDKNHIKSMILSIEQTLNTLNNKYLEYQKFQESLPALTQKINRLSKNIDTIIHDGNLLKSHQTNAIEKIDDYQKSQKNIIQEIINICQNINDKCQYYHQNPITITPLNSDIIDNGTLNTTIDNSHSVINHLQFINENYQALINNQQCLNNEIHNKDIHLDNLNKNLKEYQEQLLICQQDIKKHQSDFDDIMAQREKLFGKKNAYDEEQSLRHQYESSQAIHNEQQQLLHQAESELIVLTEKINSHKKHLDELNQSHTTINSQLQQSINEQSFKDTAEFLQSRITNSQREKLSAEYEQINQQLKHEQSLIKKWQEEIKLLTDTYPIIEQLDTQNLNQSKQECQKNIHHVLETLGRKKQDYEYANQSRNQHKALINTIETYQQELNIWAKLNELIGSADGKKYRNFVQGLTLESMLYHANKVLAKMSERYILIHNDTINKSQLEISIIDTSQGNEIRSTKNLSGGESFIISLALAMGLSQMSSENIAIDSLFLDEGFGTLDDEILDIALSTLSMLQAEGKMIGIISHVAALKERIPTQIIVKKIANGSSILSGTGVIEYHTN